MADETTARPDRAQEKAAARGTQSNPTAEPETVRFSIEDLRENPRLLGSGISRHAVAGALAGSSKKTFTLDEAAKAVERFLKSKPEGDA